MDKIKTALISVSDKEGLVEFAQELCNLGVNIISTGGTAKLLKENEIKVTEISEHTGFPEILDGRVKTLHPKVHGGILSIRDNSSHREEVMKHGITDIDLVVVNLYPFEKTIRKPDVKLDEAIENIDIGGPTMIRSAAKNYKFVAVVVNAKRYDSVLEEIKSGSGSISEDCRFSLAVEAFNHTYSYDRVISEYLGALDKSVDETQENKDEIHPGSIFSGMEKKQDLRYGENPHQCASFYTEKEISEPCVANATLLNGKELSFNNILDLNAAWDIVKEFSKPAAVVIKHTNPCGASCSEKLSDAYVKAHSGDPVSAFGCILGFNKKVDVKTAEEITAPGHFVEAIIAPDYDDEAIKILSTKRKWGTNLRILKTPALSDKSVGKTHIDIKRVSGGLLVQDGDAILFDDEKSKSISKRLPTDKEKADLEFAFAICKHAKSNSIVIAKDETVLGVGAGLMSRIDSAELAVKKAGDEVKGAVIASDAFFPFRDAIDTAASAGITGIIQPGGSNRDDEVIEAVNEHNMSMIFTGIRHFKH